MSGSFKEPLNQVDKLWFNKEAWYSFFTFSTFCSGTLDVFLESPNHSTKQKPYVNPLHLNISMHILHTVRYTFPNVWFRGDMVLDDMVLDANHSYE